MQQYDLYINLRKPAVGLYVRKGAGLTDLADPKEWDLMALRRKPNCRRALCRASKRTVMPFGTWIEFNS